MRHARLQDVVVAESGGVRALTSARPPNLRNAHVHIVFVEGQVAELGVVLRQESDESEKAQKVIFGRRKAATVRIAVGLQL